MDQALQGGSQQPSQRCGAIRACGGNRRKGGALQNLRSSMGNLLTLAVLAT